MRKSIVWVVSLVVIMAIAWSASTMIGVNQTQEAELPDVSLTGGQMPRADVGSVDVGTDTRTDEVPSIDAAPPVGTSTAPAN